MYIFKDRDYENLITGSLFFGTGGGGSPKEAKSIYARLAKEKARVRMKSLEEFDSDAILVTAFGVGPINAKGNSKKTVNLAVACLQKYLDKKIAGIVPVEIGPESLAVAMELASDLHLPLVDSDMVGGRSTPEVFLETITLFGIPRAPAVIADNKGNCAILLTSASAIEEEVFFRNFTRSSKAVAYVVGYPARAGVLKKALVHNTVSRAASIGEKLEQGKLGEVFKETKGKKIFEGTIKRVKTIAQKGFTTREIFIKSGKSKAKLFIKNENLIVWIDNRVVLTCPDLIILLNKKSRPLSTMDLKKNLAVAIVGIPAPKLWRSKQGITLFNPRVFGFPFGAVSL